MRLLVIGAGSTGAYFGARLAKAGRDVTFLVRPARAKILREKGLTIISPHGDFSLQPQLVTAGEIAAPYDVILLTVKAFQLEAALADMAPAVGAETMILPVLNGMRHMEILAERFTPHNVMGGALKVSTTIDNNGHIVQLGPVQDLAYGELDGSLTTRVKALDAFFQGAGFSARLSPGILQEMWEKWTLLASLGGICCLTRGTVGEIEAAVGPGFALAFLNEVIAVIRAIGIPPSDKSIAAARERLTQKGSSFASSMYRDVQNGLPVEAEQIIGDLLRCGQNAGVNAPLLAAAYANLCVYQNHVKKGQ